MFFIIGSVNACVSILLTYYNSSLGFGIRGKVSQFFKNNLEYKKFIWFMICFVSDSSATPFIN